MAFDFNGVVLRGPRVSPTNSSTTANPTNGVVRDLKGMPAVYDKGDAADLVEIGADQYRVAAINQPFDATSEYLIWAQNNSQLAIVESGSWLTVGGTCTFPTGSLTVTDNTPESVSSYTDGSNRVLVVDDGGRDLAQIFYLVVARGDVDDYDDGGFSDPANPGAGRIGDNPYEVITISAVDQDASKGLVTLNVDQLDTLDGGLSQLRGDTIIEAVYSVAASRFWWTRNDRFDTRFGWNGRTQKWEPFKGTPPINLGTLEEDTVYRISPRVRGFPVNSVLPGDFTSFDSYSMFRIGSDPGAESTPIAPGGTYLGILVVKDEVVETYSFEAFSSGSYAAVMGRSNGLLAFNPSFVKQYVGQTIWYSYQSFESDADGVIGEIRDSSTAPLYIAPIPGPTNHPFLRLGSRRPLSPSLVDTDAELASLLLGEGDVGVSLATGKVKINDADLAKADPDAVTFDKQYLGEVLVYDGVALNAVAQPTKQPVQVVDTAGDPALVTATNELFVPDSQPLPDEFVADDANRGLGVSGIIDAPDGTGAIPGSPGTAGSVRPGGDTVGATSTGRVRKVQDGVGDTFLFSSQGVIQTLDVVDFEADLPAVPFRIPQGTCYIAREEGTGGSKIVLSNEDRKNLIGEELYFLQASLSPSTRTTKARLYSRNKRFFFFDEDQEFKFYVDGTEYLWESNTLLAAIPGRNAYFAFEVADSIDAVITGTGQCIEQNGYLVLEAGDPDTGSVEIGYATDDLAGLGALGFLPGWRAVGGVVSWLSDSGVSLGLFRSPVNLDRSKTTADFKALSRVENEVLTEGVQGQPFFFLDRVPIQDIPGLDDGVFFQITNSVDEGTEIRIINRPLENFEDILYEFGAGRFSWLESGSATGLVRSSLTSLSLGQTGLVTDSLLNAPGIGGGLFVSEDGGAFVEQIQGTDYLLPGDGQQGSALLIERVGKSFSTGSMGSYSGSTFTDLSADFSSVQEGYRLKVTGIGSFIVSEVTSSTTLEVEPSFAAANSRAESININSAGPLSWEIFEGFTKNEVDPGLVVDMVAKTFSHVPEEPFKVNLLSALGVPQDLTELPVADLGKAVQSARNLSLRFGLEEGGTATLAALSKQDLGVMVNDVLQIPSTSSVRFTSGAFSVQVGSTVFSHDAGALVGVASFSSDPGATIEYLTSDVVVNAITIIPAGTLRFGSSVLSSYEGSLVTYVEEFLNPVNLSAGRAEYNPHTGEVNYSSIDSSTYASETLYLVEEMITEGRQDVALSPLVGTFVFQRPLRTGQIVEVEYYSADLNGKRQGDVITELLPVFIRGELATQENATTWSFNANGQWTVDKDVEPIVYVGNFLQGFGRRDYIIEYDSQGEGSIKFLKTVDATSEVKITYAVYEAQGGETTYQASTKPVYRPPFYLDAGIDRFGIRGNRSGDFAAGQYLRIGADSFYIKKVEYFSDDDVTALTIYPPTVREVGSRSPANDLVSIYTVDPVTSFVDPDDPVSVPTAPGGFFVTLTDVFEPLAKGRSSVIFRGDLTSQMVPGHILELAGRPFVIAQSNAIAEGSKTEVALTAPFTTTLDNPSVRLSTRPVYPPPPASSSFLGLGPFVDTEDVELVLFGELDSSGQELPGRTLTQGTDYSINPVNGNIQLNPLNQAPLDPGQSLLLSFSKLRTLSPVLEDNVITFPRYVANYLYNTVPTDDNGYLGATITASYSFSNPDAFYFRTVPLESFLGEAIVEIQSLVTARNSQSGAVTTASADPENWERGRPAVLSERRHLTDLDRAARTFLDFFNTVVGAFEQVLETLSGEIVGDKDTKFRFFQGRGKTYTPPGYEDEITGVLNPRNIWAEVFKSLNPSEIEFLETDPVYDPVSATLTSGDVTGTFMSSDRLDDLIELQRPLIQNDVDDRVLTSLGEVELERIVATPGFQLKAPGVYNIMGEPQIFSRLFPLFTSTYFMTYPGIGADLSSGEYGAYSWRKIVDGQSRSTFNKTIGKLSNTVLGEIENADDATLRRRRPRARIWAYSPVGFPEMDDLISEATDKFTAFPRPALIATPLSLKDFPIDPETGYPDVSQLAAEGGSLFDLTTGDLDLVTPAFSPGDQIVWGFSDGDVRSAYFTEAVNIFGQPILTGVFVDKILVGCIVTFQDTDEVRITDANRVLVATGFDTGIPAHLWPVEEGDTLFVGPPTGVKEDSEGTPTLEFMPGVEDLAEIAAAQDIFRKGFDFDIRSDGTVIDLSLPSKDDPNPFPVKELQGQNPPLPLETVEGTVRFRYEGLLPLEIPALQGEAKDDSGDFQIPYVRTQNTELDRFGQAALGLSKPMEVVDEDNNYVYPDEFIGNDGEVTPVLASGWGNGTYKEPSTLLTRVDVEEVAHGGTDPGVEDLNPYDLLLIEVGQSALSGADDGAQGIFQVGKITTLQTNAAPVEYSSQIEFPRFVTQTNAGSPIRYTFDNVITWVNDTTTQPYPADPQASPTNAVGIRLFEDTTGTTTVLKFDDITKLSLNDGTAAGTGNFNDLWSAAGAKSNNIITIEVIARTDPNITTLPDLSGGSTTAGTVIYTITIEGDTVTAVDYLSATTNVVSPVTVTFGTNYPAPLGSPFEQNRHITIDAAGLLDLSGGGSTWFLPWYVPAAGQKETLYGFEFRISIDTYNAGAGESTTGYIDEDRLTFHEVLDLRHVKARGTTHPLTALALQGQLLVEEVTLPGVVVSTINRNVNGSGVPLTFLQRSITQTDASSYYPDAAGGTWASPAGGTVRAMGFEAFSDGTFTASNIKFTAIPSAPKKPDGGLILQGDGTVNDDNHLLPTVISGGDVENVEKGDLVVIKKSVDISHFATTVAGTYVVRHAVKASSGTDYREASLETSLGTGAGFMPIEFPEVVSVLGTDLNVTNLAEHPEAPSGGFTVSGRVYIIRDLSGLKSALESEFRYAVVSAGYTGLTTGGSPSFNGLTDYRDAMGDALTSTEFSNLVEAGMTVSGMSYLELKFAGPTNGLPLNNCVGFDSTGSSEFGVRYLRFRFPSANVNVDFSSPGGTIVQTGPAVDEVRVLDGTVAAIGTYQSDQETYVYDKVPAQLRINFSVATWESLNVPASSYGFGNSPEVWCLLPGTLVSTTDGSNPGFRARAGIFVEPSLPQAIRDMGVGSPKVVDASNTLANTEVGFSGAAETVEFQVRRIRRWHQVLDIADLNLQPLKYAYEIRRGRITGVTNSVKQMTEVEASGFTMTWNTDVVSAPLAPDVWNDGNTYSGTNLGAFDSVDVNISSGDLFRVLDENGDVLEEVEIDSVINSTTLRLKIPGLTAKTAGNYLTDGGDRFEVYVRQAPVPHEQSHEQLLALAGTLIHRTVADYTTEQGGYVPAVAGGVAYDDAVNQLYDDTLAQTFTAIGVRRGDVVVIDPAGTIPQSGGLPTVAEKGARPFGDISVPTRTDGTHVAGSANALDDNRGFYRVLEVHDTYLVVSNTHSFAGPAGSPVIFPDEDATLQQTYGYAIYPTVSSGTLTATEAQNDLRPTRLRDPTTKSFADYPTPGDTGADHSLRPFSYRIYRMDPNFSDETVDLILMMRERMLSLIELLSGAMDGDKSGSYYTFQKDEHITDVGDPVDPIDGLGVLTNLVIEDLIGQVGDSPFVSDADALSIHDRRFWILDQRLDTLAPKSSVSSQVAGGGDTPYTAYTDTSGGAFVRPVLPDRIAQALDADDRFRSKRYTWLSYRTHRTRGTLAAIDRFDEELPDRLKQQEEILLIEESAEDVNG